MKKLLLLTWFAALALPGLAQKPLYFKNVSYLDYSKIKSNKKIIGGFSAIEYNPDDSTWTIVSDRDSDGKNSYIFHPDLSYDSLRSSWTPTKKLNRINVESYRLNRKLNREFVVVEDSDGSFIGEVFKDSIARRHAAKKGSNLSTANRGIESLTFMPGSNDLWYAYESGNTADCQKNPFTRLYQVKYDMTKREYDFEHEKPYEYAINRCDCLDKGQAFDGDYGNGVSEILAYDESNLLILERCYNGKNSKVRIFLGEIPKNGTKIYKKLLFDFDSEKRCGNPGNLEGMTFGPVESDSSKTIYLISDDNNDEFQQTRLVVLSEKEPTQKRFIGSPLHACSSGFAGFDKLLSEIKKGDLSTKKETLVHKALIFSKNGSITAEIPSVLKTESIIQIKISSAQNDTSKNELNKRFNESVKFLKEQKGDSPILKLLKFESAEIAADSVSAQRKSFYNPYMKYVVPYALTLNAKTLPLLPSAKDSLWFADVKIEKAIDDRERQNLTLTKINVENNFLKEVYKNSKGNYKSWVGNKEYFDTLYAEYRYYAATIDRLQLKELLLKKAKSSCNCSRYDEGLSNIETEICSLLKDIRETQSQLCALATQTIENNACWMSSWLWYTGGKPKLNPFGIVSEPEYNSQLNKRLAIAEAQLKMYSEFSKQNRTETIRDLEKAIKPYITKLAAIIAELKAQKEQGNKPTADTGNWLTNNTKTGQVLNKVLLYSTNASTIHWMNHYNAKDEFIKMNKKDALPERVYEKDVVHGVIHNLTSKQKISSKETVTKTELRTEFDITFAPLTAAAAKVMAAVAPGEAISKGLKNVPVKPGGSKAKPVVPNCESELNQYKSSKVLIEWLSEQTEPPLAEMEDAYETFDIAEAGPIYHSQESLISESRTALGTNIISYEIFEEGKDKPVVKDKYQTYENVRFWPFISVNYVFGSRASTIFDNLTNTFKVYTEMDNFEVFAGAKWYLGPSNVTRTPKRSKFIIETVGRGYQYARGNGFRGKTFLFLSLGIRHKFLKNYGVGGGIDIVPGLSLNGGVNIYFDKKYELVNGLVRKDFDIARFRGFIGLAIDVNVVTRFVSLF